LTYLSEIMSNCKKEYPVYLW